MDRFSLRGKVALVTARGFAEAGAMVAVVARTRADVDEVVDEIKPVYPDL